ncbi:MAG: FlgD immunoglobulin-like domain containing protein [bacterium]
MTTPLVAQTSSSQIQTDAFGSAGGESASANFLTHLIVGQSSPIDSAVSRNFIEMGGFLASAFVDLGTGVGERDLPTEASLPEVFTLEQNFPNPFLSGAKSRSAGNPATKISFEVPPDWTKPVTLRIFNVQGHLVKTLVEGKVAPGAHTIVWDGKDAAGEPVASGIYFYKIISGNFVAVKKMLFTK